MINFIVFYIAIGIGARIGLYFLNQFHKFKVINPIDILKNCFIPVKRIPLPDGGELVGPEVTLGNGAFGSVEKYTLEKKTGLELIKNNVAVKKPNNEIAEKLQRRELHILRKLSAHPNIIKYIGHVEIKHKNWIILELMQGTLTDLLSNHVDLSLSKKLDIAIQMMRGLAFLHKQSTTALTRTAIVHQDLKPDNLLYTIDPDNPMKIVVKISDFGVAREVEQLTLSVFGTMVSKTDNGQMAGTANYFAPEVIGKAMRRKESCEPKSDVFSAGLILWEIITSKLLRRTDEEIYSGRLYEFEDDKSKGTQNATQVILGMKTTLFNEITYPKAGFFGPTINACLKKDPSSRCNAKTALELLENEQGKLKPA